MKSAEEYFNENYGKSHIDRCIELNDKQSLYALMEEFVDSEVKKLNMNVVNKQREPLEDFCNWIFYNDDDTMTGKRVEKIIDGFLSSNGC